MIANTFRIRSAATFRSRANALMRRGDHGPEYLHFDNTHGKNLPFDTHKPGKLAIYMITYLGIGFGAPFFGCWFQWKKNGTI